MAVRSRRGRTSFAASVLAIAIGLGPVTACTPRADARDTGPDTETTAGEAAPTRAANASAPQLPAPDSARLLRDLGALAHDSMAGRAPGTPGSTAARRLIVAALEEAGIAPVGSAWEHPFTWIAGEQGVNVLGRIPGRDPAGGGSTIILTAHYDHLGVQSGATFNGADDNASGTAAVLEIARLVALSPLASDLVVALLDAEEAGLQGARALVADPPAPLARAFNVNLDMVSRSGGVLWAAGAYHTPALRPVLDQVAADAPLTLRLGHDRPNAPEGDDWTTASDHGPFHEAGVPFVYFGVEDHPDYHTPTDDPERVNPGEFVASVRTILMALRAIDEALPLPPDENDE